MKLYSLYDVKAQSYQSLFPALTDGLASRSVQQAALDPNTSLNKYSEDFTLLCVGEWDVVSGTISPVSPPRHVVAVSVLVESKLAYTQTMEGVVSNGQATVGDDASVQSGSEGDDTEEFIPSH